MMAVDEASARARALLLVAALTLLLLNVWHYWPFLCDDALISLRYADRLLHGQGLTWNDGLPRVEGYSNLLWLLAAAGLGALGMDLVLAARLLGIAGMSMALALLVRYAGRRKDGPATWRELLPGLAFFALSAPAAVWAIGGLEQPLVALLLAWALPRCFRLLEEDEPRATTALAAGLPLGLLCLTRPDGALFAAGVAGAGPLIRRMTGRRTAPGAWLLLALPPALCYTGQLAFRLHYYGAWVPNTALVKLHPSLHHLGMGLRYVAHGLLALAPFSLPALWWLGRATRKRRPRALLLGALALLWLAYVAVAGGDYFPAFRFFVPVLVLFSLALIESARERRMAWGALVVSTALFVPLQRFDSGSRHALEERWEWQGREIALALREAFGVTQPLLAVTAAGCLPYWSGLPCLDMLGLNDDWLARHPPRDVGEGFLGHELGDAGYFLRRRPDIICLHVGEREATFAGGREMQRRAEFRAAYQAVPLWLERPAPFTAWLWFRRDSPRVGIRREGGQWRVPGHLLAGEQGSLAHLEHGHLVASLTATRAASIHLPGVDESWSAQVRCRPPNTVRVELRDEEDGARITLSTSSPDTVDVEELVLSPPSVSQARISGE